MPIVSTDDTARRLRYVWLGPKGFRLPDARFPAWGLWIGLTALGGFVSYMVLPTVRLAILALIVCAGVALLATRRVMRSVDHDRTLGYWHESLLTEVDTPRPDTASATRTLALPRDLFDKGNA